MEGHVAIGHCRYSTTGSTTWENAQPVFRNTAAGTGVALGHNGNLVNTTELAGRAREAGLINPNMPGTATTDSDILGALPGDVRVGEDVFPIAARLPGELIALPLAGDLTSKDMDQVADALRKIEARSL